MLGQISSIGTSQASPGHECGFPKGFPIRVQSTRIESIRAFHIGNGNFGSGYVLHVGVLGPLELISPNSLYIGAQTGFPYHNVAVYVSTTKLAFLSGWGQATVRLSTNS